MVNRQYICGYLNLDDYTYVDVPAPPDPAPQMYLWKGEGSVGSLNGMKPKMDYNKNGWFITGNSQTAPTIMYLCRVTRNMVGPPTLVYKQIPALPSPYGSMAKPNQITADRLGNVYFPSGNTSGKQGYCVAKVTNAQDPDPANWVITWTFISKEGDGCTGSYGIALSKDHTVLVTYVGDSKYTSLKHTHLYFLNTTTMAEIASEDLGIYNSANKYPYNIETDVSGAENDNWAFLIRWDGRSEVLSYVLSAVDMGNPGSGVVDNVLTAQTERTVSINTYGSVYTGDPTTKNETYYQVSGGGGYLGVGIANPVVVAGRLNHSDIVRYTPAPLINVRYWASGAPDANAGQVREVQDASQASRVAVANYKYYGIAAEREPYEEPT